MMNSFAKFSALGVVALALTTTAASAGTLTAFYADGSASTEVSGFVNVEEDVSGSVGVYNVSIGLDDNDGDVDTAPGLTGLGISAVQSIGGLINFQDIFTSDSFCTTATTSAGNFICYGVRTLTAATWGSATIDPFGGGSTDPTFESVFGTFADAAGGDSVFHWFDAFDGELFGTDSINNYFAFDELVASSNIIGASGSTFFTAGSATVAGAPNVVPLPAPMLMLLSGLGGLGLIRRKQKT